MEEKPDHSSLTRGSGNVLVFTNPRTLRPEVPAATRLGSQGCPHESSPPKCLGQTEGRMARSVNTVLADVADYLEIARTIFMKFH